MQNKYQIGVIGLGEMGRNLVLNLADHGIRATGFDKDPQKTAALSKVESVLAADSLDQLMNSLQKPRAIMFMLPAGPPVDNVIRDLFPLLEHGDILIDGGNSHFRDTDMRSRMLEERGLMFLGVGISGGGDGARHGASLMPGGPRDAYDHVHNIFEALAARVDGEPCAAWLGPGSAGHYTKMVHNGIEYGLMRLISETYDLMKRGLGFNNDQLHRVYCQWNETELNSFLLEITGRIFCKADEITGKRLIDVILDEAAQKGTGRWTSQDAMELEVPVPTIDIAVSMRELSAMKAEREEASRRIKGPENGRLLKRIAREKKSFLEHLRKGLYGAMIITYAQGLAQLRKASGKYGYGISLETVARIWRGGCIIRAALLEDIRAAYRSNPGLVNLLMDDRLGATAAALQVDMRHVIQTAVALGIPVPAFMASLAYFDSYRSEWMPANLIQAQRDYFGAHTYERIDQRGKFHTEWEGR